MRRVRVGALLAIGSMLIGIPAGQGLIAAGAVPSPLCSPRTLPVPAGTQVTASGGSSPDAVHHPNLERWAIASPSNHGMQFTVNVLLPADYATSGLDYKVLYLLHGHGGGANDWWVKADANGTPLENIIANRAIVVMPDGGYDGWYSDWYGVDVDGHNGTDANAAPAWETFHINELIPWVDRTFRTENNRKGRLIAGLSMGGYGAMIYAARHPGLFSTAGAFSGAIDIRLDDPIEPIIQPPAQNLPDRKLPDNCVWGDGITQHANWVAHNPPDQVANLEGSRFGPVALYASAGDGCLPSPANPDPTAPVGCQKAGLVSPGNAGASLTEWGVRQQTVSFQRHLEAYCAAPHRCGTRTFDLYGPGIHGWPFWLDQLGKFLNWAPNFEAGRG